MGAPRQGPNAAIMLCNTTHIYRKRALRLRLTVKANQDIGVVQQSLDWFLHILNIIVITACRQPGKAPMTVVCIHCDLKWHLKIIVIDSVLILVVHASVKVC